jgi:uncharacterized protein YdaU (DUF1376 family)
MVTSLKLRNTDRKPKVSADAEDLAYRRLLDLYYMTETIPADRQLLVKLVGLDWDCIEPVLQRFFVYAPTGYTDPEIEDDLDNRRRRARFNSAAGKIGGRGRKKVVDND